MPRTLTVEAFSFNELSEEAQAAVISNARDTDPCLPYDLNRWINETINEHLHDNLNLKRLNLDAWLLHQQGAGASIKGEITLAELLDLTANHNNNEPNNPPSLNLASIAPLITSHFSTQPQQHALRFRITPISTHSAEVNEEHFYEHLRNMTREVNQPTLNHIMSQTGSLITALNNWLHDLCQHLYRELLRTHDNHYNTEFITHYILDNYPDRLYFQDGHIIDWAENQ